jgi:hypothetical protein
VVGHHGREEERDLEEETGTQWWGEVRRGEGQWGVETGGGGEEANLDLRLHRIYLYLDAFYRMHLFTFYRIYILHMVNGTLV